MQPLINENITSADIDGDTVYVNKVREFKTGDIVVASVGWWKEGPIIKRVVGMPGDSIKIEESQQEYILYCNSKEIYKKQKTYNSTNKYKAFLSLTNDSGELILKSNEYMLLGDNWQDSEDCAEHGPVKASEILGKADLIIKPSENEFFIIFNYLISNIFSFN